jgi:hypothetical protein
MWSKIKRWFYQKRVKFLINRVARDFKKLDSFLYKAGFNRQERRQLKRGIVNNTQAFIKELEK